MGDVNFKLPGGGITRKLVDRFSRRRGVCSGVEPQPVLWYKIIIRLLYSLQVDSPNIRKGGLCAMSEETHHKKEHDEQHLDKLTVKELRELAAEFPHERAVHDMKKEELIAFIKEAKGIRDEGHVHKHKPKGKIKMTKPEVKAKIRALKVLHWQAMEDSETEKAVLLRHQISRLKKISRRVAEA